MFLFRLPVMPATSIHQVKAKFDRRIDKQKSVRFLLIVTCCVAQSVTIVLTWSLWQVRDSPPNLPLITLPAVSFSWLVLGSLCLVLIAPREGLMFHLFVLAGSISFDQFRLQPQIIGIAVLLSAAVHEKTCDVVRWYLSAMWFWAGIHKLLSAEWFAQGSWNMLGWLGLANDAWHLPFAYSVAFGEIALGVTAALRPRWSAYACFVLHLAIALLLSPAFADLNRSVIPWNLCLAVVGPWVLRNAALPTVSSLGYWALVAAITISPASFYLGLIPRALSHTLYSDNLAHGLITEKDRLTPIQSLDVLQVPFPNSRRLLRQYFEKVAEPGEKLHISGPRPWLGDAYYLKSSYGSAMSIDRERFLTSTSGEVAGVEQDDPSSIFYLVRAKARLLRRTADGMIYAVEIPPDNYHPSLLRLFEGLPNLEQLQLARCSVKDEHLFQLRSCDKLLGIGLNHTDVTDDGIKFLMNLPRLDYFELDHTDTSLALRNQLNAAAP